MKTFVHVFLLFHQIKLPLAYKKKRSTPQAPTNFKHFLPVHTESGAPARAWPTEGSKTDRSHGNKGNLIPLGMTFKHRDK